MPYRKLLGEGLGSCSIEELQQVEHQLEKSVTKIRARKVNNTRHFVTTILLPELKNDTN